MKTLKKKIISLVLTLVFLMSVFTPLTVCAEDVIIDTLCIDFTTENAHPAAAAYELRKELKTLEGENISNGTEDVGYCMNVYLFSYTEPNMGGTRNQIESEDTDFLDPNLYYYVNFEISANNGFDFKHDGTSFDTTSLTTVVNGHEMIGIADDSYNEYWKVIDLFIPVEIDTTSKVYSVEITNSDVNVEKGDTIQFQSKTVSYGDGYDAVIWSLEGAQKAGTTISSSGLLTVAADETADSITVKVCSEKDAEKYDTVTLNVLEKLAIDSVEVDPQSATLFAGDSEVFTVTVTGTDTHEVEWQLTGNSSANTTITANEQTCTLAVGEDETAEFLTIEVTSVKDPTKSATASITVKQLTIIDRLLINYTTEKAMTNISAYELTKELRTLAGKNISNGTEDVAYCMNVYLWSYTEPNRGGTGNQIEFEDTDFLDPDLYYYVHFEIRANKGFDFKHDGTSFDTTSLTTVVNGHEMTGIADDSYNEYWKLIHLYIPVEIKCSHNDTTTGIENLTSATMSDDGEYDEVVKCEICKEEVSRTKVTIPKISSVELSDTVYTYDGEVKTPSIIVKDSKETILKEEIDYTVTYDTGRTNVGTYNVTVTMMGNYSGTKTESFKINPISELECSFALSDTVYTYDGKVKTPSIIVKNSKGTILKEDIDYTVTYDSGRTNVGTYNVTATMMGNYSGTKTESFKINPAKLGTVSLSATSYTYDGKTKTPTVTVKNAAGTKLTKNTHYTISVASSRKNAGTYKVTVTGIGNYTGTKTVYFKINPAKLGSCKLSATTYTYSGKNKTPTVTVKNAAGTKLTKNTHYTLSVASSRKNVGTYKVTIKGKGNYTGTKYLYFKILPVKTTVSKLTAGKKSITVNITKKSTQVTGYQIQYSTSKKFTSAKTKTISSYKTTKYTLKSLSAKKTYYVRVRTYKTVNGTKYYSGWSTIKSVKTK